MPNKDYYERLKANSNADLGSEYEPIGFSRAVSAIEDQRKKTTAPSMKAEARRKELESKGFSKSDILKDSLYLSYLNTFTDNNKVLKDMEEALSTGEVFGSMLEAGNEGFIPCDSNESLADLYDVRHEIPGSATRFVVENYADETTAFIVSEGETIGEHDLTDCIQAINTTPDSVRKVASILNVPETDFEDDPVLRDSAVYNVQERHTVNGENALLLDMVIKSKDPVTVAVNTLFTVTNQKLSANARKRAEIITNEAGFAKLDTVDASGARYITKDFQIGEFVFADRYIVRILPDAILPDFENESSPVLIGDWKNVLRLAVILKYVPADAKNRTTADLANFTVRNKAVERVIPALTTTSDKAYFIGAI